MVKHNTARLHETLPAVRPEQAAGQLATNAATSGEAAHRLSPDDMYARLLDPQLIPNPPVSDQSVEVRFVADNAIQIKDQIIELNSSELFILNAFALMRSGPCRTTDLIKLGFRSTQANPRISFNTWLRSLNEKINAATDGLSIINVQGKGPAAHYLVYEHVLFTEGRLPEGNQNPLLFPSVAPNAAELDPSLVRNARETTILSLAKKYKDHPRLRQAMRRYDNPDPQQTNERQASGIRQYFKQMGGYRLLTRAEEIELFNKIEHGIDIYNQVDLGRLTADQEAALVDVALAYQAVYCANLRLAVSVASRYFGYDILPQPDLVQEANKGLSDAILKFDVAKGYKFSTYAAWWIMQAVTTALAKTSRVIPVPTEIHRKWLRVQAQLGNYTQQIGHTPNLAEMSAAVGMSVKDLTGLLRVGKIGLLSLEQNDVIPDDRPDRRLDNAVDHVYIQQLCRAANLSAQEMAVLSTRYQTWFPDLRGATVKTAKGAINGETFYLECIQNGKVTLEEISVLLGCSHSKIHNIEKAALQKLRAAGERLEAAPAKHDLVAS